MTDRPDSLLRVLHTVRTLGYADVPRIAARPAVEACYRDFLPLNDVVARACSDWQLAELGIGGKQTSLEDTVAELRRAADAWEPLEHRLAGDVERFAGYLGRFTGALAHAVHDPRWITGTDRDSAHRVWFELHEDLIATLGLSR
ncbi:hypothetical protein [Cellulomonas timonensis]|uniref:hypothetical protein n=1 Tax=Cellulomonas timonensis TaxID=1689271 RepID=UPI0009EE29CC|nr:hypothetical protein [Cellulomonas timonensis]